MVSYYSPILVWTVELSFAADFHFYKPGEPVPEETFTHSHSSWSSIVPHLLHPSTMIHPHAWQSFFTVYLQVLFGLPLSLAPSTSYSIHFFTQSLSSFRSTCPYHRNLFRCSTEIMSSNPSLSCSGVLHHNVKTAHQISTKFCVDIICQIETCWTIQLYSPDGATFTDCFGSFSNPVAVATVSRSMVSLSSWASVRTYYWLLLTRSTQQVGLLSSFW